MKLKSLLERLIYLLEGHCIAEVRLYDERQVTPEWAAEFLAVDKRTLEQRRYKGEGPDYVKVGGRVLYRVCDLKAYQLRHLVKVEERAA